MSTFVHKWRLREICNIADSMAYQAAYRPLPLTRLLTLAQEEFLKPNAHIRLMVDPRLEAGKSKVYIQHCQNARCIDGDFEIDLFQVTIFFNGDLTTKDHWEEVTREILRCLGQVIFFSTAAKRLVITEDENAFINIFVDKVLNKTTFVFDSERPRFTLAKLHQIAMEDLIPEAKEVCQHVSTLLRPYLGPDGW